MAFWNLSAQQLNFLRGNNVNNRLLVVAVSDENGAAVTGLVVFNFVAYMSVSDLPGGMVPASIVSWPGSSEPAIKEYFPGVYTISIQAQTPPQNNPGPTVIRAGQVTIPAPRQEKFTQMGITTVA
jgi:hypothetical protein